MICRCKCVQMAVELGNGTENWLQRRRSKSAKGGIQKRAKSQKKAEKIYRMEKSQLEKEDELEKAWQWEW